jgi:hypothetical protein
MLADELSVRRISSLAGSTGNMRRRVALALKWQGTRCERANLAPIRRERMTQRLRYGSRHHTR